MYYIYIIECEGNCLYTGIAKDIVKRLTNHYIKKPCCAKFTKSHQMVNLKSLWSCETKSDALKLEYRIKKLSKSSKIELINNPKTIDKFFKDEIVISNYSFISKEKQLEIFNQVVLNKL